MNGQGTGRTVVVAVVGRDLLAHGDGLDNAERDHLAVPQQLAVIVTVVLQRSRIQNTNRV